MIDLYIVVFGMLMTTILVARILTAINALFEDGEVILGIASLALLLMCGLAIVELFIEFEVDPLGIIFGYF